MDNRKTIYMPPMAEILAFEVKDILSTSGDDDCRDDIFDEELM